MNSKEKTLFEAIESNDPQSLSLALERGANPNQFESGENFGLIQATPLSEAAWRGHLECVKLLIGAGANVNAIDLEKWSALHFAAYHSNSPETCSLLIQMGSDISLKTLYEQTALDLAKESQKYDNASIIEGVMRALWEREQLRECLTSVPNQSPRDGSEIDAAQDTETQAAPCRSHHRI